MTTKPEPIHVQLDATPEPPMYVPESCCAVCLAIDGRTRASVVTYGGHTLCEEHFARSNARTLFAAMLAQEGR